MTALTPGTVVVAKHPLYRGAWWGHVTAVDGEKVAVMFTLEEQYAPQVKGEPAQPHWLPAAIVLARELPAQFHDGVDEHYWRKDQEVEAERLAFHHDPANKGKVFWPETYID